MHSSLRTESLEGFSPCDCPRRHERNVRIWRNREYRFNVQPTASTAQRNGPSEVTC